MNPATPRPNVNGLWLLAIKAHVVVVPVTMLMLSGVCIPWVKWQTNDAFVGEAFRQHELLRIERMERCQQDMATNVTRLVVLLEQHLERDGIPVPPPTNTELRTLESYVSALVQSQRDRGS